MYTQENWAPTVSRQASSFLPVMFCLQTLSRAPDRGLGGFAW